MKLLSCHVENFGKLSGFSYIFEDGLNVLFEENGWGKSTFAAFLKVMFYGFDGETRRSGEANERLRYKPWGGGVYGGSVTFQSGGRVYRMHRSFGVRKKEDTFLLFDDATGLPSSDFTDRVGEELFGIDSASFTRTVFWSQQDHETEATALIQAKIGDVTKEQGDLPDYDRAMRQVQREIDRLSPERASGLIRKKEARAAALTAEAARLPQLRRRLSMSEDAQRKLTLEAEEIRRERQEWAAAGFAEAAASAAGAANATAGPVAGAAKAGERAAGTSDMSWEAAQRAAAERAAAERAAAEKAAAERAAIEAKLDASRNRLERLREIRREAALAGHSERKEYLRLQKTIAREEQTAALALSRRVRTLRALAIAAFCAALLFFVLTGTGKLALPFLVPGTILLLCGLYAAFRCVKTSSEDPHVFPELMSLQGEELVLRASLEDLSRRMKRAEAQIAQETRAQQVLRARLRQTTFSSPETDSQLARKPADFDSRLARELADFDRREEDCRRRLMNAAQETDDLRGQIEECEAAQRQLQTLQEELETLRRQYETCVRTASFLAEARTSFNARYMHPFLRSFRRHYGMLTGESADNLQTDADFGITVLSEGLPRDPALMSEGTRDLISLCRRMAMIDAMYPGEKPFLVLDDPFSNLDDERVKGGMRFLHNASFEYQILYMTCHASRV